MNAQNEKQLSKLMSLMLRHEPEKFGLQLDDSGFTSVDHVLRAVCQSRPGKMIGEDEIRQVVKNSDKQRFEIVGDKIRARYGHSVEGKVEYIPIEPPDTLYHGTSPQAFTAIQREGLQAMYRQYVHLSIEPGQAKIVGRRHTPNPIILRVRAHKAWQAGVKFYQPEARLFLADFVPPEFIENME